MGKRGPKGGQAETKPIAYSMYTKDAELVEFLSEYFGCSRSEAVRTAVRNMAAHIGYLEGVRK